MLMSDSECDSMFDIDCLLDKQHSQRPQDPFLNNTRLTSNALKLAVDRQASLEDLAHVIRADSQLAAPAVTDAADTIQDLAKYLKDDSQNSPTIPNLISASSVPSPFSYPSSSLPPAPPPTPNPHAHSSDNAPMHNYASRRPSPTPAASLHPYKMGSRFPVLIKQERPDSPDSSLSVSPSVRPAIQSIPATPASDSHYSVLYTPHASFPGVRRKRPVIYKEEVQDSSSDIDSQERDASLPPPRKYVRKNPKQIKDLDEYRKRRERNNEAVRRARAKKRQTEALIHSENRQLRAENQRLSTQLEASRLQIQTQERIIAHLRGSSSVPAPRVKKVPKRLSP